MEVVKTVTKTVKCAITRLDQNRTKFRTANISILLNVRNL